MKHSLLCSISVCAMAFVISFHRSCCAAEKYVLLTSLYHEQKEGRIEEYKKCLLKNLEHPLIEKIIVFFDTKGAAINCALLDFIKNLPITIEYLEGRPTFKLIFNYADYFYHGRRILVSNADIYFNDTLQLLNQVDFDNLFVALTRWDEDVFGRLKPFHGNRSQDVWIYRAPFRSSSFPLFELGTWQCDGKMAKCAFSNGYKVINPLYQVQACHVHNSSVRNYTVPKSTMQDVDNFGVFFGGIDTFYRKPDEFNRNIFGLLARSSCNAKILIAPAVKSIKQPISNILESDSFSLEIVVLSEKATHDDIRRYGKEGPVLLLEHQQSQDFLPYLPDATIGWSGSIGSILRGDLLFFEGRD
jgi:hypothetical protein